MAVLKNKGLRLIVFVGYMLTFSLVGNSCLEDIFEPKPEELAEFKGDGSLTFSCLVNGEIWNFGMRPFQFAPMYKGLSLGSYNGEFRAYARRDHNPESRPDDAWPYSDFTIEIDSFYGQESYALGDPNSGSWAEFYASDYYEGDKLIKGGGFYTKNSDQNIFTVTQFDTINRIISGRFKFELQDSTSRTIKVTEGFFDFDMR